MISDGMLYSMIKSILPEQKMKRKYLLIPVMALILTLAIFFDVQASRQGCGISEFIMDPTDPYIVGDHVFLSGKSNCGTVRFEINGEPKSETGQPNQTMMWNTEEAGAGNFDVCFVARGDGGWENAARACRHVYVEGGQAPPSGSENTGGPVKCWVNVFNVSPGSVKQGEKFHLTGQGQCDGNARASRFSVDGNPFSEFGGYQTSANLGTKELSIGSHQLCFHITGGSWDDDATSCVWVEVSEEDTGNNDVIQGDQAENNVQGQTGESGSDGATQPQSGSDNGNSCAGSALPLSVGDTAQVNPSDTSNNLRRNPHLSSSWLAKIPGGDQFTIIGGPTCADGYWWWEVDYQGQNGWTAQGDGNDIWIGELDQLDSQDSDETENNEPGEKINPQQDTNVEPPLVQEDGNSHPPEGSTENIQPGDETLPIVIENPIADNIEAVCDDNYENLSEYLLSQLNPICGLTQTNEVISGMDYCLGFSNIKELEDWDFNSWWNKFKFGSCVDFLERISSITEWLTGP